MSEVEVIYASAATLVGVAALLVLLRWLPIPAAVLCGLLAGACAWWLL